MDLSNRRFGNLIALCKTERPPHIISRTTYWLCRCDCGKEHKVKRSSLLRGEVKSCGCGHNKVKEQSPHWKGYGDIYGDTVSNFQRSAKRRGLDFDLDAKYLWELFQKQNGKCYISGIELKLKTRASRHDSNASLDRIDSSKGYIKGNVGWVYEPINHMKWDMSLTEFLNTCKQITNYNETRKFTTN